MGELSAETTQRSARQRRMELGLIFAFWTFLAILTAASRILDPWNDQMTPLLAFRAAFRVFLSYFIWALLTPLIFWVSRHFSIDRSHWLAHIALHVVLAVVVAIGVDLYTDLLRALLPMSNSRPASFNPWRAVTRFYFVNELVMYVAVLAAGFAREYFLRYQMRQEEATELRAHAARLQTQLTEARLQTLRMQINPHFLFNTLHAVSTLVERDPQGVRRMIARLSELLRYTLEGSTDPEVTLRRELQFLSRYIEIQQIRFQGRLEVHQQVDPHVLDALIPNLILQPLVENAIKHGASKVKGTGQLWIRAWREGPRLCLSIADNGPGLSGDGAPESDRGFGLRNTRARLEELYGEAYSLSFETSEESGLVARIALPFHTAADLRTTTVQS